LRLEAKKSLVLFLATNNAKGAKKYFLSADKHRCTQIFKTIKVLIRVYLRSSVDEVFLLVVDQPKQT
jgi:hypothetical protein